MIQIFDQLDKIVESHFELEKGFLLETYSEKALSEGILTQNEVNNNTIGSIRQIYILRSLSHERSKIYQYIDENASGAANKESLTLFIERVFNKIGKMRKAFHGRSQIYFEKLRQGKDEKDGSYPSLIYSYVANFLDEIYYKVETTYGYLLPHDLLKKYELYPPLGSGLLSVFKDAQNAELVKWKDAMKKEAYSKPSLQQAIHFVLSNIQFIEQQQILNPDTAENYAEDEWSHYFGHDYKRKLKLLQSELKTLKKLDKLYAPNNETGVNKTTSNQQAPDEVTNTTPAFNLDYSSLNDYFFTEKIDDFKKLETELLQRSFLNEKGHWHQKKKTLVALIYILERLAYLRPQLKGKKKGKIRLTYRKFFEQRYHTIITKEMQPSQFNPQNDINPYKAEYHFISGINTI